MAVPIHNEIQSSINGTRLYRPGELTKLAAVTPAPRGRPRISVSNDTTLRAARRLYEALGPKRVALLNFASARNPGGGFLSGSQAQEESLARASGLYAAISRMTEYYEANRRHQSALYTDNMIYSPRVPVFRDDDNPLIDDPWCGSMITAPAVNADAVRSNEPENQARIPEVMGRRIECVLALAAHHGHDAARSSEPGAVGSSRMNRGKSHGSLPRRSSGRIDTPSILRDRLRGARSGWRYRRAVRRGVRRTGAGLTGAAADPVRLRIRARGWIRSEANRGSEAFVGRVATSEVP